MSMPADTIRLEFIFNNQFLTVVAEGYNHHFNDLVNITRQIHKKVVETKTEFLLLDFQQVDLKIVWADCFNLVRMYESSMPEFNDIKVAGIFSKKGMEYVKYWQEIASSRGYKIELFPNRKEGEKWLLQKINEAI